MSLQEPININEVLNNYDICECLAISWNEGTKDSVTAYALNQWDFKLNVYLPEINKPNSIKDYTDKWKNETKNFYVSLLKQFNYEVLSVSEKDNISNVAYEAFKDIAITNSSILCLDKSIARQQLSCLSKKQNN